MFHFFWEVAIWLFLIHLVPLDYNLQTSQSRKKSQELNGHMIIVIINYTTQTSEAC